jgi:hypothetical protein
MDINLTNFLKFLFKILAFKNLQKAALFNFDTAFLVVAYIGNQFFDVSDKTGDMMGV